MGFVVVSHREPKQVSHFSKLRGATETGSGLFGLFRKERWEAKSSNRQSLQKSLQEGLQKSLQEGFLKSTLAQWSSALPYQSSSLSDASPRLPDYCCIVRPSPPLHLSVYLLRAVLLILLCWLPFSLCGAFVLSRRLIPWKPRGSCITADTSSCHGCGKSQVNGDRLDLSLIWQQCKGTSVFSVKVAEQRRRRLRQCFCFYKSSSAPVEWSAFFLCFSQSWKTRTLLPIICHRARANEAELRVNIWWTGSRISEINIPCFAQMPFLIRKDS